MRRLICLCLLAAGCNRAPPPGDDEPAPAAAPDAQPSSAPTPWVPVRPPGDTSLLEMPARVLVAAATSGAVAPPFPARLVRVHVRVGERIARGAPVVDVVMPQLVSAAGAYLAARTRVAAYSRRKAQLERLRAEGLTRLAELADVETRLAEARADHETALATLRVAGVAPDAAADVLASSGAVPLSSPIDGVVVELNGALGETRDPGGPPIARIAGDGPPRIEARLAHPLPAGARFTFITPAGTRYPVRLVSEAPVIDPRDGTRAAWFEPLTPVRLSGGMTARLAIQLPTAAGAVVVPASAIGHADGGAFVVRRGDGGPGRVSVEVLSSSGVDALVRGPLRPGDEVAADVGRLEEPAR